MLSAAQARDDRRRPHRHLGVFSAFRRVQARRTGFAHGGFQNYLHDYISD